MPNIWDQLAQPPAQFRSIPFWSWNDKLETKELERQIEEMHKAGIGGFFMHARGGLQTPYMGEEWMEAIRACILKAQELGMEAWLYDENGWPSGFGDGKIPAKGLAYQQKLLAYEHAPFQNSSDTTIAFYSKTEAGYELLPGDQADRADLRLYYEVNPYYIDALSKMTVEAFIESTYEVYWQQFGEEFGSALKGVFTDEPQFARGQLPWSFEMEETFEKRYGYDVKKVLPGLFLQIEGCSKDRYDYWECVTTMFTEAFAKQIGDWCRKRGWSFTGHVVDEQALMIHVTSVGDPMATYEYMQVPGCDWLGRFINEDAIVPKQVGSVAHQLGMKQTITESFGCSGWNVSFEDLKRIGEWQFVHGINLLCQHLQGYSMKGLRKRDYPPSLFVQQPWWGDYKGFNDYFARLSMLLSEGTRQVEVLLLHPVRTAWTLQNGKDRSEIVPYHNTFAQLSRWMCQSFIEHDFGSESIIANHGKVKAGQFIIGQAAYRVVVVPPSTTLNRITVDLLKEFIQQGGCVIACAPYPTLINGEASEELEKLISFAHQPEWSSEAIVEAIHSVVQPSIRMKDKNGAVMADDTLNVQTLELDGSTLYYVVNSGYEGYEQVEVELLRKGKVCKLDLETGEAVFIQQEFTEDGVKVQLPFRPGQSYMLKLIPQDEAQETSLVLNSSWQVDRVTLNSLTLDSCRIRVGDGEWSAVLPVISLQEQLLAYGRPVDVQLEFEFDVDFDVTSDREFYLVLENHESFEIKLNGNAIEAVSCGTWTDVSFHKINLGGKVQAGNNRIWLKTKFYNSPETYQAIERSKQFEGEGNKLTFDTEIESIYLVGSFGVESRSAYTFGERKAVQTDGPFVLTEVPDVVSTGDLVQQGFPFFAGTIRLKQKVLLELGNKAIWKFTGAPDAIVSKLFINGHEVRTFLWEPYEANISSWLRQGENVIEVELTNSCRNLLGPHHHILGEIYKVGPSSFTNTPGWTDKDVPKGTNMYTEWYTFVQFGLNGSPYIEIAREAPNANHH